jgi:hypothetical protein
VISGISVGEGSGVLVKVAVAGRVAVVALVAECVGGDNGVSTNILVSFGDFSLFSPGIEVLIGVGWQDVEKMISNRKRSFSVLTFTVSPKL